MLSLIKVMKGKRFIHRILVVTLSCTLLQSPDFILTEIANAGSITTDGLVINYDHSSFTAGSSTVTNLVPGKTNATLRSGVTDPFPTMGGSSSRNYFTTTSSSETPTAWQFANSFMYTNTGMNAATFGSATNVSAFAWIYPTTANHVVLDERGSNYDARTWYDTQIEMVNQFYNFRVWNCPIIANPSKTSLNAWHYVGFTYNGTTLTGYVDGVPVVSGPCARSAPFGSFSLFYGVGTNGGTDMNSNGMFNGGFRFGALHIYNKALTSSEVSANASTKITQTLTLSSLGTSSKTYPYSQALNMSTTGSSGSGAITYAVSNGTATGCSLSNNSATATLTATTEGTCSITATIASDDFYDGVTSTALPFTFSKATQTLSFATSSYSKGFGETQTVNASSAGTGTITYSAGASTACTVSVAVVTITSSTGSCIISASRAADTNYLAATSTNDVTITVSKAAQNTLTLISTSGTFLTNLRLSISGGSGLGAISYSVSSSGTAGCSVTNGDSLTAASAGTCTVVAKKEATADYLAAFDTRTVTIGKASLSFIASAAASLKYGATTSVTYTTSRSLGVGSVPNLTGTLSYETSTSTACTVNSATGLATMRNSSGSCNVRVSLVNDTNYSDTSSALVSITPAKADTLTVTTATPAALTYTGSPAAVAPTVNVSGLVAGDTATGATFNFSRAPTCAQGGVCQVGDTGPGGGKVFYVSGSAINAATGVSKGGVYLEMAPATFSKTLYNWCEGPSNPYTTLIGASGTAIGTGANNTKIMIQNCNGGAGFEATSLNYGGQTDWFLPSFDELQVIYGLRDSLGLGSGDAASGYLYWSSTESSDWIAASLVPWAGVGGQNKGQATPYLPIRAFSATVSVYSASVTAPTNAGSYVITPSALVLAGGITTDYYKATVYETATLTINKASQSAFTSYQTLLGIFGNAFNIYKYGGSGDGEETVTVTNGTATGCVLNGTVLTVATAGTCVITATKATSENYLEAASTFTVILDYYVPEPVAPEPSAPTQIAVSSANGWSINPSIGPTITGISPVSGPVGTVVTITGTGMNGVDVIKIGRKNLTSVTGIDSTSVSGVIPVGATSGPILVSNSLGSHFVASGFAVTP
jgi:hypothetical protein